MSSHWTPSSSSRESDYYRPNVTLNHGRPPRPGPRQPDCYRPGKSLVSSEIQVKQEELTAFSDTECKQQTIKLPKSPGLKQGAIDPARDKAIDSTEIKCEAKKRKVKLPKLPNPNLAPLGRRREGFVEDLDDSNRLKPDLDQELFDQRNAKSLNSVKKDSGTNDQKLEPSKLPNPSHQPLSKRQMGVINSIMREEEQKSKNTKGSELRGGQRPAIEVEPSVSETVIRMENADEDWETAMTIPTKDDNLPKVNLERPPCRPLPNSSHQPSTNPQWSRTKLSASIPSAYLPTPPTSNLPTLPPAQNPTSQDRIPTHRQKLDFGNRVDQCLLKMDKWADAWLSNALTEQDPNPDTDNAWNSFEYCLGMPDILEEGEIVEYEEVPRRELPVEAQTSQRQGGGIKRKRKWDEGESTEAQRMSRSFEISRASCIQDRGALTIPPITTQQNKNTPWNTSDDSERILKLLEENAPWMDMRESRPAEFRSSSSPEEGNKHKNPKVFHIPSAATLREEARRRLMD